jgi:cytochrome bd-type quinol oxidase subunit 2
MSAISSAQTHGGEHAGAAAAAARRKFPPVTEVAIATLALIVAGGIYLAAKMPGGVTLAPAIVLLGLAVLLLVANIAMTLRIRPFARARFFQVARWLLLAYVVIAGMLAYVFIYDGVRGGTLAVLCGMLVVFGVNTPLIVAFTVARYADPDG